MFVNWIFFRLLIVVALDYRKRTQMWKMWLPKPNRARLLRHHPKARCLNNCQTIHTIVKWWLQEKWPCRWGFHYFEILEDDVFPPNFQEEHIFILHRCGPVRYDLIFFFYLTFCQFCFFWVVPRACLKFWPISRLWETPSSTVWGCRGHYAA